MTDVIQTHHLSASVANDDSFVALVERHAHPKRLYRVQVRLCNDGGNAVNHQALVQKITMLLARKNIRSSLSVRPFEPGAAQHAQGMHELTLFERPSPWKVWLSKLGLGPRATAVKPESPPPISPPGPASVAARPNHNPKLHEAFGEAIRAYAVSDLGDWLVESLAFNYRDQQAHDVLAPMISAMPAAELLAHLCAKAGRSDLVPAEMLTVSQHLHSQVGEATLMVGQGDLWVDVLATPACLVNDVLGDGTAMPMPRPQPAAARPVPSIRYTLDSQTTTLDDLRRHLNQRVKTNAQLTRVELRLSQWGKPPLTEPLARAAVISLLRERGLSTVQASVKTFAYALQHADAQHTLTLFEAPRPSAWWQRLRASMTGQPGQPNQAQPVQPVQRQQAVHHNHPVPPPPARPEGERREPVFTDIQPL